MCLQPLDYETAPEHRLNITAQGPGPGVAGGVAHLRLHKDNTLFSLIQLCLYTCLQPLDYESGAPEHRLNITIHGAGPWAGVAGGVALDMYENYILLQNNQTFFLLMKVHFFLLAASGLRDHAGAPAEHHGARLGPGVAGGVADVRRAPGGRQRQRAAVQRERLQRLRGGGRAARLARDNRARATPTRATTPWSGTRCPATTQPSLPSTRVRVR